MIARVIDFSLKNRFLVLGFALLLVAAGIYAVRTNPVDAIPDISETQIIVFADWPGRSPQEVEDQVSYPIVVNLQGLAGVKAVRSSSAFGFSMINVIFEDGTDLYFARTRILERMNLIASLLPKGVTPILGPDASAVGQVFWYSVEGEGKDLGSLRAIQDWYVRYQLNAVPGVAEVASIGGFVRQYQIDVEPNRLAAFGLSIRDVVEAVERSNNNVGGKVVEQGGIEYVVRGLGLIQNVSDVEKIVVASRGGTPVYVSNLGTVQLGAEFRRGALEKNGREIVGGVVTMRYGESAPEIIRRVKTKIGELSQGLPEGVRIVPFYDRSALIEAAVGTLKRALLEEILLVTLAHIVFLMHFRSILIVTLPLPLAILTSFILMRVLGITSNIMSLGGIAIAIGVLVDAAIVITENVFRHYETDGDKKPLLEIVRDASKQIGRPIFFSMVIILLAFLPVFSLAGEEGKLFHPLAFTKTFAMVGATVLAVTLVPVLASFLIRGKVHREEQNPVMRFSRRLYEPALAWALQHKGLTLAVAGALFLVSVVLVAGAGILLAPLKGVLSLTGASGGADRVAGAQAWLNEKVARGVGREFMPPLDEGTLMFMPVTANTVSLTQAVEIMKIQDRKLREVPEVASVVGKVGRAESPLDPAPINMYETLVELKPRKQWRDGMTKEKLIAEMTQKAQLPGVTAIWQQPIRNRIDMLATGIPTQVGVKLFGPDLATLEKKANEIAEVIRTVTGAADVYAEQILGTPYLEIAVDREAAARYGVNVGDVLDIIETALGGENLTTTIEGRNRFPVRVRYARELRDDLDSIRRILVPAAAPMAPAALPGPAPASMGREMATGMPGRQPGGISQVPLAQLADIRFRPGPSMISSENGLLRERVFLNVRGRDVGSFVEEAKKIVEEKVTFPAGYFLQWSGQYEHQIRARNRLAIVAPLCFAIIFVLLYMTYRSAKEAAHVILAIPFALTGGNLLLWLLNTLAAKYGWATEFHMSVAVWVGYIALFGTAVQTAVVMVVYLEEALLRKAAVAPLTPDSIREAAMDGAVLRLRPKLMTVSTVVMGLLPIMWSTATGSEVMKPIATPVLGGMVSSLFHVLIVTPVIWTWLKQRDLARSRLEVGKVSELLKA